MNGKPISVTGTSAEALVQGWLDSAAKSEADLAVILVDVSDNEPQVAEAYGAEVYASTSNMSRSEAETTLTDYGMRAGDFILRDASDGEGKVMTIAATNDKFMHNKIVISKSGSATINGKEASVAGLTFAAIITNYLAFPQASVRDLGVAIAVFEDGAYGGDLCTSPVPKSRSDGYYLAAARPTRLSTGRRPAFTQVPRPCPACAHVPAETVWACECERIAHTCGLCRRTAVPGHLALTDREEPRQDGAACATPCSLSPSLTEHTPPWLLLPHTPTCRIIFNSEPQQVNSTSEIKQIRTQTLSELSEGPAHSRSSIV